MRITTISYRHTMAVKPYESITFESTAEIAEGENAAQAAAALSENVDGWCEAAVEIARDPHARVRIVRDDLPAQLGG